MSIIVNIRYTGENGNAKKFMNDMIETGVVDEIRNESGNERYEYYLPVDDPETILLIDCWKDQQALDIHHSLSLMNTIAALREKYDLHMKVERYVSDLQSPLASDEKFIRK